MNTPFSAALCAVLLIGQAASAQSRVRGTVRADSAQGRPLGGAEVTVPDLKLTTRTDDDGRYQFDGIASGRYVMLVRAIGFASTIDSIVIAGDGLVHDIVLGKRVTQLDTVTTIAKGKTYISPALRGFEERRAAGNGHFIGEDELRVADVERMSDLLTKKLPGMTMTRAGGSTYMISTRTMKPCASVMGLAGCPKLPPGMKNRACFTTIYLDGLLMYDMQATQSLEPPDANTFNIDQFAGIEYYAGEAAVPFGYKNSGCGVLLLWTRER
ncbi:MAG: hypothetical protein JWM95_445 [Gemmatimonadetes bacterium]|nr:hypothetical protein [Gemmatimonadota bacterium]